MSIGIITIIVLLILGFAILTVICVKIHKQLKQQELIQLVNDISYEISRSNFNGTRYTFSLSKSEILIPLDKIVITENYAGIWYYKDYKISISVSSCEKSTKCIIITGSFNSFKYVKSVQL